MIDVDSDDDDNYFTPIQSSNLASLFNTTMLPLNQDKSLTFTPVKQPKPTTTNKDNVRVSSTIIAFKQVHAFQMKNQKDYINYGKCGLAFLGNEKLSVYTLMLYKTKENIISTSKPNQNLVITITQNNYISYTDDNKIPWVVNFETETDIKEFIGQLVEKCNCKVINQIESKETKDVKEEKMKEDEEKSKTSENYNRIDLFQDSSTNTETKASVSSQARIEESVMPESSINRLSSMPKNIDSDTSDSSEAVQSKKADILSRVAKMGKKLFDNETGDVTDSSDYDEKIMKTSERTESTQKFMTNKKGKIPKHSFQMNDKDINYPVDKKTNEKDSENKLMVPYNSENKTMISTAISSDQLNMYFIEQKNSASEMKVNMMKLQNDVADVLKLVKKNETDLRSISTQTENESLLEENQRLLLVISQQNDILEKLKEGNENLRVKNEDLVTKAAKSAYKIASLAEQNSSINTEVMNLTLKLAEHENTIKNLKEKVTDLSTISDSMVLVKKSSLSECEAKIKENMNHFYAEASSSFEDDQDYDGPFIKKYLAQTIVHNTFTILETIKDMFKN